MRVIFLKSVPDVARVGEIKEVADGYGRNYLIPRKLALLAKSEVVNSMQVKLDVQARSEAQTEAELRELAAQLDGKEITIEARAGAEDKLYGSITAADIAIELESATSLSVDKRKIELEEPIRQTGSHEITIRLAKDIVPKIVVKVTEQST